MDTNERELILKDEVFAVVGAAMEVLNFLVYSRFKKKVAPPGRRMFQYQP